MRPAIIENVQQQLKVLEVRNSELSVRGRLKCQAPGPVAPPQAELLPLPYWLSACAGMRL